MTNLSIEIQTAILKFKTYILSIVYSKEEIDGMLELKMDKTDLILDMTFENGDLSLITTNNNIKSEQIDFYYDTGILEITTSENNE